MAEDAPDHRRVFDERDQLEPIPTPSFDEDLADRRYVHADVLWRATLRRAGDISRAHTATTGCRALDVLHVATALELGLHTLVTFDRRQQQLARVSGLKVASPGA